MSRKMPTIVIHFFLLLPPSPPLYQNLSTQYVPITVSSMLHFNPLNNPNKLPISIIQILLRKKQVLGCYITCSKLHNKCNKDQIYTKDEVNSSLLVFSIILNCHEATDICYPQLSLLHGLQDGEGRTIHWIWQ